jgi:hypothetical protein
MQRQGTHHGIAYEVTSSGEGEWQWSFTPPSGLAQSGRILGKADWALKIVKRAIEVWRLHHNGAEPTWLPHETVTRH